MQNEDTAGSSRDHQERRDLVQVGVCAYFKCAPAPMSQPERQHLVDIETD